jgi:hypothetical protein
MLKFREYFDVTMFADYNRTRGLYQYITGPVADRLLSGEVAVPTTLPAPTQLPPTSSQLARGNIDVVYALTERWGLGLSVWYERYRVKDFSFDADALPGLAPGGALVLGYLYQPYTATTVWGRAVYKF